MKKIDKSLLFMLLVFGIYGAVGVLSSESVTAVSYTHLGNAVIFHTVDQLLQGETIGKPGSFNACTDHMDIPHLRR